MQVVVPLGLVGSEQKFRDPFDAFIHGIGRFERHKLLKRTADVAFVVAHPGHHHLQHGPLGRATEQDGG